MPCATAVAAVLQPRWAVAVPAAMAASVTSLWAQSLTMCEVLAPEAQHSTTHTTYATGQQHNPLITLTTCTAQHMGFGGGGTGTEDMSWW